MQEDWADEDIVSNPDISEEEEDQEAAQDEAEVRMRLKSKALVEFRGRVEQAILSNSLIAREHRVPGRDVVRGDAGDLKDIKLWGVPLLPSVGHGGTDTVLDKFLKAKHYKVHMAFCSLQQALNWRDDFWDEEDSPESEVSPDVDSLWFTNGRDKEGRPLFYTVLGKEARKRFMNNGDHKKYLDYLQWRIQCVEKGIQTLDLIPGGVNSFIQIIDFKNAPGIVNREIKLTYKKMLTLLKENYPGLVHRTLIVNVPPWLLALNALNLRFISQKGNNRFIFVRPSKVTATLLKYATIQNILVQYGGLKRVQETEFCIDDEVLEADIKANSTEQIKIPANEVDTRVTWDVTVVGYAVTYREEFIPDDECSYKILLQVKKMGESIRNTFYIREPGNIVITIVNLSHTKKKAFYRYKSAPLVPVYMLTKS